MSIIPSLPDILVNGTPADATQVMANFYQIQNDVNANAAASGANSDITSLTGLTTPLGAAYGGTGGTGGALSPANNLSDVANPATALSNLHGAPLASPTFTGTPSLPTGTIVVTQPVGTNNTTPASTAYVIAQIPVPQVTIYASGSGTYTTPANTLYLDIESVGGGGAGGNSVGGANGTNGGNTTFGTLTAGGGQAGNGSTPQTGGTASSGDDNFVGGGAQAGALGSTGVVYGGAGGASPYGGAGYSTGNTSGVDAAANTGSGGAGGGTSGVNFSGAGGQPGGFVRKKITTPSATYSYSVGAGGTPGTATGGGNAGSAGAAGRIKITAYVAP